MVWRALAICLFICGLGLGVKFSHKLMGGEKTLRISASKRQIAGNEKNLKKLETFNPQLLHVENIIASSKVKLDRNGHTSFYLGNYIDPSNAQNICSIFDRVEFVFRSEGMAVSGDPIEVRFEGPCPGVDSKNQKVLHGFPLFSNEICDGPTPADLVEVYPDVFMSMTNRDTEFPLDWVLVKVRFFYSLDTEHTLVFSEAQLREITGEPTILSCPPLY